MISNIGLNLIVGLSGTNLSAVEEKLLRELKPIGIILFKKNISTNSTWKDDLKKLLDRAKELTQREEFIISIDHEGGRVHRFNNDDVTHFQSARIYREKSFEVGKTMAEELRALGFNLNFAPVIDIHTEPQNTVIGDRAFSNRPEEIAQYAMPFLEAMETAGVKGCIKHFPGHGRTIQDSHYELPVLNVSKEEITATELAPYKTMLSKASLVMTAHVVYPQLDPDYPATLSEKIINGLLRNELGYTRAVITDDLEMKALSNLSPELKAIKAINAGVDILLEANPSSGFALEIANKMAAGILNAIDKKKLDAELITRAQKRISELLAPTRAAAK